MTLEQKSHHREELFNDRLKSPLIYCMGTILSPFHFEAQKKAPLNFGALRFLAGPVRFELTMGFPTPVFKTGAFNRSATDPN